MSKSLARCVEGITLTSGWHGSLLASGRETRVIDMANMVNELTGNEAGIRYIPRRKWDHKMRLLASIEKAGRLIGYHPQTDFRAGLENNVRWFRDNWEWIRASARF